jgi:hypothetical protein
VILNKIRSGGVSKLQSFPLQHINEKLVQHPDYYHIQGAICVSIFYVMIAMDSKSLKDDKSLFKHLFECKDCCVSLCESALGTILELKQKRHRITFYTVLNSLCSILMNKIVLQR